MRYHSVYNWETGEHRITPMTATTDEEARAEFARIIDDCPECQALRAQGEVPNIGHLEPPPARRSGRFRRPRWRDLRRRIPHR